MVEEHLGNMRFIKQFILHIQLNLFKNTNIENLGKFALAYSSPLFKQYHIVETVVSSHSKKSKYIKNNMARLYS